NKSLSDADALDKMLEYQGIGLLKRKAVGFATVTLCLNHYKDADGVEHLDIEAIGVDRFSETHVLTWAETTIESPLLGSIVCKMRRIKAEELDDEYLKTGWTADTIDHSLIQSEGQGAGSVKRTCIQVRIEEINGERRHTRHSKFTGPKEKTLQCRLVYDYGGLVLARMNYC
ncbi:hypothetical protein C8R44DRAFT_628951, partial [Mycena epipterygia]